MKLKKAIYPGSFDPLHKGHIQIIKKSLKLFDKVYVVVSVNPDKNNLSNLQERYFQAKNTLKEFKNVEVLINENEFIANIAKKLKVNFLIRSARNINDFNYELELAAGNKHLNKKLETILIIPNYSSVKYSSTLERHKERLNK